MDSDTLANFWRSPPSGEAYHSDTLLSPSDNNNTPTGGRSTRRRPMDRVFTSTRFPIIEALSSIAQDTNNHVVVFSKLPSEQLAMVFEHASPRIGLVAESGFRYRVKCFGDGWACLSKSAVASWLPSVRTVMQEFTKRTPGSWIEDFGSSLTWHYDECETEFGELQAKSMYSVLQNLLVGLPTLVNHNVGSSIEVYLHMVKKKETAKIILNEMEKVYRPWSFMLLVTSYDEDEAYPSLLTVPPSPERAFWEVTIGASCAEVPYLNPGEVEDLLVSMAGATRSRGRDCLPGRCTIA